MLMIECRRTMEVSSTLMKPRSVRQSTRLKCLTVGTQLVNYLINEFLWHNKFLNTIAANIIVRLPNQC